MSAQAETHKATVTEAGPESPTTARPFEMDDDDVLEPGIAGEPGTPKPAAVSTPPVSPVEPAPPKPPRPQSETQTNVMILKEAFPSVEEPVIKAILRASGGRVETAFNALLEMSDPDAAKNEQEEVPPPQPPRPQGRNDMTQVEADELYARKLAEHYDNVGAYEARTSNRPRGSRLPQELDEEDREHSFIDDDLPVIRENLRKGFLETQKQVNGWITNLRKKIEDNFDESEEAAQRPGQPPRRQGEASRRSGDYERYDADPQVLSDDFAGMKFSTDGTPANQGVHKPPPSTSSPMPSDGRRVAFKGDTEEINMYDASPQMPPRDTAATSSAKASKWQPLSAMDPNPIADNDPFSLGDSEDEKDAKDKDKPKDSKADEGERLKQAAAEAMADELVKPTKEGDAVEKKS
ncbi:CUE domain-containing protein [Hirsutella rhossiliensis]|uniref:CUE domain-containing protein n=1 Tax=Hirsutella rhossiliensis TaxID=111463 RepID=A0A9P8N4F4_9HYPO|nr:CUE domain-containing protein [Hirsutella rhossiliensis]KAH0966412.1 CUE domain-containing protein [Hirsutella rhossiliensis]